MSCAPWPGELQTGDMAVVRGQSFFNRNYKVDRRSNIVEDEVLRECELHESAFFVWQETKLAKFSMTEQSPRILDHSPRNPKLLTE